MPPTELRPSETARPPTATRDDRAEADRGLSRRSFLRHAGLAGGTALVVAAGGVSYRAYDRGVFEAGEGGAYDAWRGWDEGTGAMALVSAAILAANPHNSQAWVFRTTPARIDLFADRRRTTGALDPFDREMYVGLGCALENLLQAARANGYRARVTLLPTAAQPVHAARIDVAPGPLRRAALYRAIPDRHTDRTEYRQQAVPAAALAQMTALAGGLPGTRLYWYTDEADRRRIGTLMVDAARAVTRDEQQSRDGFGLFRSSWDDIQKFKDGLTLDTQGLSEMTTALAKMRRRTARAAMSSGSTPRARPTPRRPRRTASWRSRTQATIAGACSAGGCWSAPTSGPRSTACRCTT